MEATILCPPATISMYEKRIHVKRKKRNMVFEKLIMVPIVTDMAITTPVIKSNSILNIGNWLARILLSSRLYIAKKTTEMSHNNFLFNTDTL